MRSLRFAVIAYPTANGREWAEKCRRVESLGYGTLLVTDSVRRNLAIGAALMAAAGATTTLRIGSWVYANDFRHPLMLAAEAASIDVLSDGRLDFGIGTGSDERDYEMVGVRHDTPRVRVDRLKESVALIRRLWSGETVDHAGTHYHVVAGRIGVPPIQRPHPPILVGGGGPVLLRFAAREADIVGIFTQRDAAGRELPQHTLAAIAAKAGLVRTEAGARWDALDVNIVVSDVAVTDHAAERLAKTAGRYGLAPSEMDASPAFLVGSPDHIAEKIAAAGERMGINYYAVPEPQMESFATVVRRLT